MNQGRIKYPPDVIETIAKEYSEAPTLETVRLLANRYEVPIRSVIGKLTKLGVYKKEIYVNKAGERPVNKEELVVLIERLCEEDPSSFEGLEKAPKKVLRILITNLGGDHLLEPIIKK